MTRITGTWPVGALVFLALLAAGTLALACDDEDDDDDDVLSEAEEDDDQQSDDSDQSRSEDDPTPGDTDVNTSPSSGTEYLSVYTDIASDLQDDFAEECVESVDLTNLDFSDVDVPDECRDYFDEFAARLDEVEPPDACADLHKILLDALNALAEGEDDALSELLGGDGDQPSEGIVEASVDCSGI